MNEIPINPFKTLGLPENFEIENLDQIYFKLYKDSVKNVNKLQEINNAYAIVKDPIERAKALCHLNGYYESDSSIAQEIFSILLSQEEYEVESVGANLYESILQFASAQDWKNAWKSLQKYLYVKKMNQNRAVFND